MAGTDGAADDDALFVLTAQLLTPARFPGVLGDDYPAACAALGLAPHGGGYGLVLGQDGAGARWTVVIDDVSLVAVAIASWDCGMEYDLSPGDRSVVAALPGWPLAVATVAPGVPAPHDPDGEEVDGPPLAPPDTSEWGPAQRRLGADEVALQWGVWRAQVDEQITFARPDALPEERAAPHEGVRRVLRELHGYVDDAPPLGRVRSSFASDGARMLRADGPGWSLVARTDDIALVLLDEEPGEVLPVGRGPELPGLLEALDRLAVRPS
ncbi:hypothetical protein SSP531S_39190 [Streptomyces spongiicola]|uniref:Integral membrane protein n=1 Tax=Streptomyces spongiicola TaxID=1690221 RepID=A0A2S1YUA9_9ACTN|nr:hypothetical protein [Streptomyces spongiicola]AWK07681.1 hypothetical protein DDQ41_00705 [Streptomyces spongiicola]GBQ02460.1 hypothetical protein SSP531S_39190 [Streptomyces spongiicola]